MNQILIRVLCGVLLVALAAQLPSQAQTDNIKPSRESLDKALCKAAKKGDAAKVKEVLGQGAPVDTSCGGRLPLYQHVYWRNNVFSKYNPELVEALLQAGASPDDGAITGLLYGFCSKRQGSRETLRLLLEYGADVNRPYEGYPSILAYVEQSCPPAAEMMRSAAKIPPEARKARMLRRHAREAALAVLAGKLPDIEALERSGDEATNAGKLQAAFDRYLAALKDTPPDTDKHQQLREKVIRAALSMKPAPPVPEGAKLHADRAQAFLKRAQDAADYERVISELEQASLLAPWWAPVYYNLGSVREKAQDFEGAVRSLKLYLLAAPQAQDAEAVRKKIVDLEVARELEEDSPSTQTPPEEPASPKRTP